MAWVLIAIFGLNLIFGGFDRKPKPEPPKQEQKKDLADQQGIEP